MSVGDSGLLDLLIRKMSYLNQAQVVHAENVANTNTPGYKPLEVKPFDFDNALKQANVGMTVTNARHIVPASLAASNTVAVQTKSHTGNSDAGDVEQESMKVAQTGIEYQLVTTVYHKIAGLFKIALKGSA